MSFPPEASDRTATLAPGPCSEANPSEVRGHVAGEQGLTVDDPDRYELIAEHARGGLGRVVRAMDRRLGRTVAVKELHTRSLGAEERFLHEALITARLEHPGIVPVHEAGRWPSGEPYYVMKFLAGRTLKAAIAERPTVAARLSLLPEVIAVADAVGYAHSKSIVHRDLKPSNVMLGDFGETSVVDWGLALELSASVADGAVIGTPAYMAPEQLRGEAVDARADVYSLGAILYEVLAGRPPYQGATSDEVLAAVKREPPPPLAELVPDVAADLLAIAAKAMSPEAACRYPDGRAFADDLRRFHTGQLVTAHDYGVGQRVARVLSRYRGVVIAAAIGLAVLLVVGAASVARIVSERNRAQHERTRAVAAQSAAEARQLELTQVQARASLRRDPTETIAWLKVYPSAGEVVDRERAALLADALAEGVAQHVWREPDWVRDAVFSPDGTYVATASADGVVRLYRVDSGAVRTLGQVTGAIAAVAWSPQSDRLVVGTSLGEVRELPLSGSVEKALRASDGVSVSELRWSSDGTRVLSQLTDGTVDIFTRRAVPVRQTIAIAVDTTAVAVSPDTWRLVYGTRGGQVVAAGDGDDRLLLEQPTSIDALAIDRAGQRVAFFDGVQIWMVPYAGGDAIAIAALRDDVNWMTFSDDGARLAIGGDSAAITILQVGAGLPAGSVPTRTLRGHADAVYGAVFAHDGAQLLSASDDGTARLWDLVTGDVQVLRGHDDDVVTARFSPDESMIATASLDGSARLWRLTRRADVLGQEPGPILRARFALNGNLLIAGDNFAASWNLNERSRTQLFEDRTPGAGHPALMSPDGTSLLLAFDDFRLQLLRLNLPAIDLSSVGAMPVGGDFVDGGRRLIVGTRNGEIRTWEVATGVELPAYTLAKGEPITTFVVGPRGDVGFARGDSLYRYSAKSGLTEIATSDAACVRWIAFEPTGDGMVTTSCASTSLLRRPNASPLPLPVPNGHRPVALAWSADGNFVAGAITNRTAIVWNAHTGAVVQTLKGHTDLILSLAISDDGSRVITGSYDRTARTWDVATNNSHVLRGHGASVEFVAFSEDNKNIVTASRDRTIRIWPNPTSTLPVRDLDQQLAAGSTAVIDSANLPTTPGVL